MRFKGLLKGGEIVFKILWQMLQRRIKGYKEELKVTKEEKGYKEADETGQRFFLSNDNCYLFFDLRNPITWHIRSNGQLSKKLNLLLGQHKHLSAKIVERND